MCLEQYSFIRQVCVRYMNGKLRYTNTLLLFIFLKKQPRYTVYVTNTSICVSNLKLYRTKLSKCFLFCFIYKCWHNICSQLFYLKNKYKIAKPHTYTCEDCNPSPLYDIAGSLYRKLFKWKLWRTRNCSSSYVNICKKRSLSSIRVYVIRV